jgi:hypothetical protein
MFSDNPVHKIRTKNIDVILEEMRSLGETLVEYNFPLKPVEYEDDLSVLKLREATVDGYGVFMHFSKSDYGDYFIENFQIFSKHSHFLPLRLVLKLGQKMLGSHELYLLEIIKPQGKVYCFMVTVDHNGKPMKSQYEADSEVQEFEGVSYRFMDPSNVKFY